MNKTYETGKPFTENVKGFFDGKLYGFGGYDDITGSCSI